MTTVDTNTVGSTGAYATLELWEAGEVADLPAGDIIARAAMQDELHTGALTLSAAGWNTDATRYIWIDAEVSARHDGTAGSGARLIPGAGNSCITIDIADFVHVTWLELSNSAPSGSEQCIDPNLDGITLAVDKLIMHGLTANSGSGIRSSHSTLSVTAVNCIGYNLERSMFGPDGQAAAVQNWFIYNCVGWDVGDGAASDDAPLGLDISLPANNTVVDLRNTAFSGVVGQAINTNTTPTADIWDAGCNKTILDDASGTTELLKGAMKESVTFQAGTGGSGSRIMFANLTGGSEDLHLVRPATPADNQALDYGDNLTALAATLPTNIHLETDIDGKTRPSTGGWDVGADQTDTSTDPFAVLVA